MKLEAETGDVTSQLCTFLVDELHFGVPVEHVQEVLRYQEMTPVPLAPAVVAGLINLRGHIVTALDLRARLGLAPRGPDDRTAMNVVIRIGDSTVSLLVDDIGDVVEVEQGSFESTPPTLHASIRSLVGGVYKLKGELLLLLEAGLAIQMENPDGGHRSGHGERS